MRGRFIAALICTICFAVLFKYGRNYWYPVYAALKGKDTVSSVIRSLSEEVKVEYQNIDALTDGQSITLIALKEERILELWKKEPSRWRHIRDYPFTGFSGVLGPKLKEGDLQIPEGLYEIEYLNPNSSYHLSMKVSYPNDFDKAMGDLDKRAHLGGDIFIHGKNVTIGCIPIGDKAIEELFYIIAKNGYTNTQVIIAPYDMRRHQRLLEIETIDWEQQLYSKIYQAITPYIKTTLDTKTKTDV